MAAPKPLAVWMYNAHLANLREARSGKVSLEYTEDAFHRWTNGLPLLSLSMPLEAGTGYPPSVVDPWIEGLLPEDPARRIIEQRYGLRRGDVFGLLAAIGRDCAGAVVIQDPGAPPPEEPGPMSAEPLSDTDLQQAIEELGAHPLGVSDHVRVSLAGQQDKLLLARAADGRWGRPTHGSPSTHILKPQDERFPFQAYNEATCVNAAAALGIGGFGVDVAQIGGRTVQIVERYDRSTDDGLVHRIHQEDFCQALSLSPAEKYWSDHDHRLSRLARLLDAHANDGERELAKLLAAVTYNVAIGNADAHAKNYALLHAPEGTVALAPLYDAMSTIQYPSIPGRDGLVPVSRSLPIPIGSASTLDDVGIGHLIDESRAWGIAADVAEARIRDVLLAVPDAIGDAVRRTGWDAADPSGSEMFLSSIEDRITALRAGRGAGAQGT